MKKRIISAFLALATAISLSACNAKTEDIEANQAEITTKQEETQKTESTEQVKNAVTGETETTIANTEKTHLDRNTNINISMANFEDYTADEMHNIEYVLPGNNEWRLDIQCAYSTNLTTGDDTVTEITEYQKIIDAFHENNNVMTVNDIASTIEANKFDYEASYSYEGLENTPNNSRVMPENIDINYNSEESVVYGFILKSKDFNIKNFTNIGNYHTSFDENTKTLYIAIEGRTIQCDSKLQYKLRKINTEIHPIITIDAREYLDAENIVFIKPERKETDNLIYDTYFKNIAKIEFLAKHVDENLIIRINTDKYILKNISDDLENLTLARTEYKNGETTETETFEIEAWKLMNAGIYCDTYPEINY